MTTSVRPNPGLGLKGGNGFARFVPTGDRCCRDCPDTPQDSSGLRAIAFSVFAAASSGLGARTKPARSATSAEPGASLTASGIGHGFAVLPLIRNTQLDAVVTFRPQVCAVLCVDQLRRDPDAVAVLANAAFQNVSHAKLLCARVSGQGARSGTNFTRSSEPASWMA